MGSTNVVVPSKVFNDGHFLCIKGIDMMTINIIHNTLNKLKSTLDEGKHGNVAVDSLFKGKILACKLGPESKHSWMRCQVVHKDEYVSSGKVFVKLMEFENEYSLPLNWLRDMSAFSIKELTQPAKQNLYYVDGVYSPLGWPMELLHRLHTIMTQHNNKISLRPTFQCRSINFAQVFVNEVNVADLLQKHAQGYVIESNRLSVVAEKYFREKESGFEEPSKGKSYSSPSPDFGGHKGSRNLAPESQEELDNDNDARYRPLPNPPLSIPCPTWQLPQVQRKSVLLNTTQVTSKPLQIAPPPLPIVTTIQPVAPPVKSATTQSFLTASEIHDVQISHIENGAKLFYVQLSSQMEIIGELSKRMQASALQQPQMLQEGSVYLVKQGSKVFRCLLISSDPFRGRLIDYGNTVNANFNELFTLPESFAALGRMSYRFALAGFCSNQQLCLNPDAVDKFNSLVKVSDKFQLKVVDADGPPISQYCELYKNNVNLLTTLHHELNKPTNYEKHSLLNNAEYEVLISYVDIKAKTLPWTFYVQMVSEKSQLDALSEELMQICNSAHSVNADQLIENAPIMAKYEDNLWYRGLLLQKDALKSTVYFVDYGNTDKVALDSLRMPARSVVQQMPEQAIRCVLDGCSTNLNARDIMQKFTENEEYILTVVFKLENNTANVRLKEKNSDVYLNDKILRECWAAKQVALPVEAPKVVPLLKVLTPSELGASNSDSRVELKTRRPEKQLFTPSIKHRNDWDHPSNGFFADKRNPEKITAVGSVNNMTEIIKPRSNYDEPDRSNLKRASNSTDDWASKRIVQLDNVNFSVPPPPIRKAPAGDRFNSFEKSEMKTSFGSESSGGRGGTRNIDNTDRQSSYNRPEKRNSLDVSDRKPSYGERTSGRSESMERGDSKGHRSQYSNQGFKSNEGRDRQGRGDRFDSKNDSNEGSCFSSWKSKDDGAFKNAVKRSDDKSSQDFQADASPGNWKPQGIPGGHSLTGGENRNGLCTEKKSSFTGASSLAPKALPNPDESWECPSVKAIKVSPKIPAHIIKIGERLQAQIVYTINPDDFFVQPEAAYSKITDMTEAATTEFIAGTLPLSETFEGDFCWAKYPEDSAWYRARVLSKAGENWKVLFVDYGNTSEVSIADMRPLKEEHASLPVQGIRCLLRGCSKSDWPKDEKEKFEAAALDIVLDVTFVAKLKEKFSVLLCKESECINTQMGASEESLMPINSIKWQTLEMDSTHNNMTVAWVMDPKCILMHRSESCESLKSKIDVEENSLPRLPICKPELGTLVHIEVNKKLLRGSIVAAKDTKFKVQLVDYGRVLIYNQDSLNALPEEFATYPRQAIVCSIKDVEPTSGKSWPKTGSDPKFDAIFMSCKTFTIYVKSVQDDGKLDVVMTREDGEDVADLLRKHGFAAPLPVAISKPVERAVPNTEWKVFVTQFYSHMKFFVQKESEQAGLNEMQDKLLKVDGPALTEFEVGQLILAKYGDVWYRACVIKSDFPIEVFMMDYGDEHTMEKEHIETKALPQEFAAIPSFATCCCIPMAVIPGKYDDLQAKVEEKLFEGTDAMTMKILAVANEYLVVDFKSEESSMIENYVSEGLTIRTIFEGYVTNTTSLEGFDVQNVLWTDKIDAMTKTLENAESYPPLVDGKLGTHCVAKFEDGIFYRAQITLQSEDMTEVCFIDYGNSAQVQDMRQIPDEVFKVQQLSQLLQICNIPKSKEVCDKIIDMLSDGNVKFEFMLLNPTSYPLEVVVFKDGIDLRKLATPGFNVLATEFSPQPLDLLKMVNDMSQGKAEKVETAVVYVQRDEGNVALKGETDKEPMECDVSTVTDDKDEEDCDKAVEKELEEGYTVAENHVNNCAPGDDPNPEMSTDDTKKVFNTAEKIEDAEVSVENEDEMNVSSEKVGKEEESHDTADILEKEEESHDSADILEKEENITDMEVSENAEKVCLKQEKSPYREEKIDEPEEKQQKEGKDKEESDVPAAHDELVEKDKHAPLATESEMETSETIDMGVHESARDKDLDKVAEENEPSATTDIENPDEAAETSEDPSEDVKQPCSDTPEKVQLAIEQDTESPSKSSAHNVETPATVEKTSPSAPSHEFSSPKLSSELDCSSLMLDSEISPFEHDSEHGEPFTFTAPMVPVRLFEDNDETPSVHSSNMSLESIDDRCDIQEKMPINGAGDADEVRHILKRPLHSDHQESGDFDVPIKRATLDMSVSMPEISVDDKAETQPDEQESQMQVAE